jgi:hypothetical protein
MDKNIWMNVMININDNINPIIFFLLLNRAWDLSAYRRYHAGFSSSIKYTKIDKKII